jgi:AraC family transcriptional regulator
MNVTRRILFEGEALQIGAFAARPLTDACGDVERQHANAIVLPVSGVFAKHEAPGRHVIGTPTHAVFFAAQRPYRISFPGAIGDRALTLRFGEELAPDHPDRVGGGETKASHALLSAGAMVLRNLLWRRLHGAAADGFEIEARGLDLVGLCLRSMHTGEVTPRRRAHVRRMRALARVKEAVAAAPADKWDVAGLARLANLSPFHLSRVFREMVGASIYDYVLHERLAWSLDAVLDGDGDLTGIALDAGFSSHSHFTARFRRFFGCTPTALRRAATAGRIAELRKIVTARRH